MIGSMEFIKSPLLKITYRVEIKDTQPFFSTLYTTLSNGNIIVFWNSDNSFKAQIFDSSGNSRSSVVTMGNLDLINTTTSVTTMDNGNLAVLWEGQTSEGQPCISMQILDLNGKTVLAAPVMLSSGVTGYTLWDARIDKVTTFSDGNIAVFWHEDGNAWDSNSAELQSCSTNKMQIFDVNGNVMLATPIIVGDGLDIGDANFTTLTNGDIAIFLSDQNGFKTQVIDAYGNFQSADSLQPPPPIASLTEMGNSIYANANINPLTVDMTDNSAASYVSQARSLATATSGDVSGAFKALLTDKNLSLPQNNTAAGGYADVSGKADTDLSKGSAAAVFLDMFNTQDIEAAMRLASIMKNPTEDQKFIISAIKALLLDTNKLAEDPSGKANPELKKAESDLLNMVANVLLAQAMPDLLTNGDVSNIKSIFSNLNNVKGKIMLQYEQAVRPYYENVLKDIAKNMSTLQMQNVLSVNMTKEELDKLPPSELDKILEKMKKQEKKTFEEEYILQQEAKYRSAYLDPNKKKLGEDMKGLMKDFTSQIGDVLKTSQK